MGLLDWFRRPPPIADRTALADFLDSRAAFLVQKSIFDYARGRSGPYFSMMVKEASFRDGVEEARWKSYPYGLSVVTEMVHGVLLPLTGEPERLAGVLRDIALEVFDRYPVPTPLDRGFWSGERVALALRCEQIALHPPKNVKDIPLPFAKLFFDNMPIHEKLRELDFELITSQLRVTLINMHRDFTKQADLPALAAAIEPAAGETAA